MTIRHLAAAAMGHVQPWEWSFLAALVALLAGAVAWLLAGGHAGGRRGIAGLVERGADSLRRVTGLPAWCAAGIGLGLWALLVAGLGFYWDVAWHLDLGRDRELFTPPHLLILVGLAGIGIAALAAIALASHERAATGLRILGLRVPFSALPMGCLSLSAMIGFPLDDLWHRTYGIDVTMWSPTHLMMIGAASFTPVAMALMLVEGGRAPRRPGVHRAMAFRIAGAALVGLSTFQLEFDLGIPQWQALYQPVLIMAAGGLALVAARAVLGRGAALLTAVSFLVIRGMWALLIGFGLGHTLPRFPLYLGVAASVELGFWLGRGLRPLPRALVVGACVGTLGLASEWAFSQVWGRHPWQAELLPHLGVAVAAAIAAAVIGMAAGRVMAYDPRSVPLPAVLVAAAALVALLAVPFPRTVAPVSAHLATAAAGPATLGVDQYGMPALVQPRTVTVTLTPAGAASGADQFEVISWQGGGARNTPLRQVAPGRFAAAAAVPTGGTWKSLVILTRGSEMMAVPVYMPASPDYGQAEIAAPAAADLEFAAASRYLIRPRDGDPGPARAITAAFFTSSGLLALLFLGTFLAIGRQSSGGGPAGAERGPKAGPTSGRPRPRLAGVVATADGPGL